VVREIEPKCSFCGKSHRQVAKVVAGPGVWICNECVALCNEIMIEEVGSDRAHLDPMSPRRVDLPGTLDVIERAAEALGSLDPELARELWAIARSGDRADPGG